MRLLHYLEIENFKRFGDRQRIELDHPAVLIGPNNCGKTTAMQAIALWSQAVRTWHGTKGKAPPRERTSTSLNQLSIVSVPVQRTRYFWHRTHVRRGNAGRRDAEASRADRSGGEDQCSSALPHIGTGDRGTDSPTGADRRAAGQGQTAQVLQVHALLRGNRSTPFRRLDLPAEIFVSARPGEEAQWRS